MQLQKISNKNYRQQYKSQQSERNLIKKSQIKINKQNKKTKKQKNTLNQQLHSSVINKTLIELIQNQKPNKFFAGGQNPFQNIKNDQINHQQFDQTKIHLELFYKKKQIEKKCNNNHYHQKANQNSNYSNKSNIPNNININSHNNNNNKLKLQKQFHISIYLPVVIRMHLIRIVQLNEILQDATIQCKFNIYMSSFGLMSQKVQNQLLKYRAKFRYFNKQNQITQEYLMKMPGMIKRIIQNKDFCYHQNFNDIDINNDQNQKYKGYTINFQFSLLVRAKTYAFVRWIPFDNIKCVVTVELFCQNQHSHFYTKKQFQKIMRSSPYQNKNKNKNLQKQKIIQQGQQPKSLQSDTNQNYSQQNQNLINYQENNGQQANLDFQNKYSSQSQDQEEEQKKIKKAEQKKWKWRAYKIHFNCLRFKYDEQYQQDWIIKRYMSQFSSTKHQSFFKDFQLAERQIKVQNTCQNKLSIIQEIQEQKLFWNWIQKKIRCIFTLCGKCRNHKKDQYQQVRNKQNQKYSESQYFLRKRKKEEQLKQFPSFKYCHFIIPYYRRSYSTFVNLLLVPWMFGIIILSSFFLKTGKQGIGDRLATVATLFVAVVAYLTVVRQTIPQTPIYTFTQIFYIGQVIIVFLFLVHTLFESLNIENDDNKIFDWKKNPYFWVCFAIQAASSLFIIIAILKYQCNLVKYNCQSGYQHEFDWECWNNPQIRERYKRAIQLTKKVISSCKNSKIRVIKSLSNNQ